MKFGIFVTFVSMSMVLWQVLLAWRDGFFTPAQMRRRGVEKGMPISAHGGMWTDFFFLSPILGLICGSYAGTWSGQSKLIAFSIGIVLSWIMHMFYKTSLVLEAHVRHGKLMGPGKVHWFYMSGALGVLILFYFFTPNPDPTHVKWITALLIMHLIITTHCKGPISLDSVSMSFSAIFSPFFVFAKQLTSLQTPQAAS